MLRTLVTCRDTFPAFYCNYYLFIFHLCTPSLWTCKLRVSCSHCLASRLVQLMEAVGKIPCAASGIGQTKDIQCSLKLQLTTMWRQQWGQKTVGVQLTPRRVRRFIRMVTHTSRRLKSTQPARFSPIVFNKILNSLRNVITKPFINEEMVPLLRLCFSGTASGQYESFSCRSSCLLGCSCFHSDGGWQVYSRSIPAEETEINQKKLAFYKLNRCCLGLES